MKLCSLGSLVLLAAFSRFAAPVSPASGRTEIARVPKEFTGKVTRVFDGDSLEVRYRGLLMPVQLFAVDAPELGQPFGSSARDYVHTACLGKSVTIYGRRVVGESLLAIVRVNGKGVLNELLLNEGIAWFDRPHGRSARLARLEANARRTRRGLWKAQSPVAPWIWRQKRKASGAALQEEKLLSEYSHAAFACRSRGRRLRHDASEIALQPVKAAPERPQRARKSR